MVSTESGHKSRKKRSSKSRASSSHETQSNSHYDRPRNVFNPDDHVYDVVRSTNAAAANDDDDGVYENVDDNPSAALLVQPHYENLNFEEVDDDHVYLNVELKKQRRKKKNNNNNFSTYDVPRSCVAIYDHPVARISSDPSADNTLYDYPKGLIPLSARLLLNARKDAAALDDADSLDGDNPSSWSAGRDIDVAEDEGIEDSDPKGLGIIVEEADEENCYINVKKGSNGAMRKTTTSTTAKSVSSGPSEADSASVASSFNEEDLPTDKTQRRLKADVKSKGGDQKTDKNQRDRCIEVYHETMRQRNSKTKQETQVSVPVTSAKEEPGGQSTIRRMRKFLPSVRALRSQFESKSTTAVASTTTTTTITAAAAAAPVESKAEINRKWRSSNNFLDPATHSEPSRSRSSSMGSLDGISCSLTMTSSSPSTIDHGRGRLVRAMSTISIIQPTLASNVTEIDYDTYKKRHSTAQWNPTALLDELYTIDESLLKCSATSAAKKNQCINIEGVLDKLPTGRRKATFWNAWKRRVFKAQDGYLRCYQNSQSDKPNIILQLQCGHVENMENNMISIDDGKGHYVVVKGSCPLETERWYEALLTHIGHGDNSTYANPLSSLPKEPSSLRQVLVLDLGSSSIRAGILSSQRILPQIFFPSVAAIDKNSGNFVAFGCQALLPEIRAQSTLVHPLRPSNKISKYMLDMEGVSGLIRTAIRQLNVDASTYEVQVSIPRQLNQATQAELARLLFEEFAVQSVNLTHQSILSLLSYNSKSGIVVDIGERIDIIPIMDGYMLETSASQVPYGGQQMVDHLRHFLVQQRCSLITDVESYLIRYVLEKLAFVAGPDVGGYTAQLQKARKDPSCVRGTVDLRPFSNGHLPWDDVSLELGRFQVTEGLFHPEAWGLDNPGVQKMIHKAIQDCSMDIRKEMVSSIFLSGGITLLPNFPERLQAEVDRLTPPHLVPKVHASPYRYHASYIGACLLGASPAFDQSKIRLNEWKANGLNSVRKWKL